MSTSRAQEKLFRSMKARIKREVTSSRSIAIKRTELLSSNYQSVRDQSASMGNTISAYMMIPGLRGLWTVTSVSTSQIIDYSGQGRHMDLSSCAAADPEAGMLLTYIDYTNGYCYRGDEAGIDITGALSFGCWVYFDTVANVTFYGKIGTSGSYSYWLSSSAATGYIGFNISTDGTNLKGVTSNVAVSTGRWYFVGGRFTPSTEVALFVDDTKYTNTTTIPATIHNSAAQLQIGGNSYNSQYLDGRTAIWWISFAPISDAYFSYLYQSSRWLFGA